MVLYKSLEIALGMLPLVVVGKVPSEKVKLQEAFSHKELELTSDEKQFGISQRIL